MVTLLAANFENKAARSDYPCVFKRLYVIAMKDYSKFLKEVESLNEKYASIYINCELEPLVMPFWSWQKIQDGLKLRREWEVGSSLIPFYGDWHDLFCLNEETGEIVALNGDREAVYTWVSAKDFISSLSMKEIVYDERRQAAGESFFHDSVDHSNGKKKH